MAHTNEKVIELIVRDHYILKELSDVLDFDTFRNCKSYEVFLFFFQMSLNSVFVVNTVILKCLVYFLGLITLGIGAHGFLLFLCFCFYLNIFASNFFLSLRNCKLI